MCCVYLVLIFAAYHLYRWRKHYPWLGNLHEKSVLVTGCDTGFGRATAKSLYNRGVYVFAACFTETGAKSLREETGERLQTLILDVSDSDSIHRAYQFVKDKLPQNTVLWGVVNNAGIGGNFGPLEFVGRDDMRRVMEVNCFGMIELAKTFLPLLKQSKGRLVNVASMAGEIAMPRTFPYTASKFALRGCSEALRHELGIWGIDVATVEPGTFMTNILNIEDFKRNFIKHWENQTPETKEEYGKQYLDKSLAGLSASITKMAKTDLTPVVRAYEHALLARHPYAKYRPGLDCKVILFIREYCPGFIIDFLAQKLSKSLMPQVLLEKK